MCLGTQEGTKGREDLKGPLPRLSSDLVAEGGVAQPWIEDVSGIPVRASLLFFGQASALGKIIMGRSQSGAGIA